MAKSIDLRMQAVKFKQSGHSILVAAKRGREILAPLCYKEMTTGEFFENWIEGSLLMDNTSFHRKKKLKEIENMHNFSNLTECIEHHFVSV